MASEKILIKWSDEATHDLKSIYYNLLRNSKKKASAIRSEIFIAPRGIIFPEQFQLDNIHIKYRRIIVRNYKILYSIDGNIIRIALVINSHQDTSKY